MDQSLKYNWQNRSLYEQMANVGAEIGRTINWKQKNKTNSQMAFYRALELLSLSKSDQKNKACLGELCRLYEMLVDWWLGNMVYQSDDKSWERYFYNYNYAMRRLK